MPLPVEAVRRVKYLMELRKQFKLNDARGLNRALGNYQEWYVCPNEMKTSRLARTEVAKFIRSLASRD